MDHGKKIFGHEGGPAKLKPAPPMRPDRRDDTRRPAPKPKPLTYLQKQLQADAKRLKARMKYDRAHGVGVQGP